MIEHTPKPWDIDAEGRVYHRPSPLTKYVICEMQSSHEENERLIIASPDLLEASKAVLIAWQKLAEAIPYDDRIEKVEFEEFSSLRSAVAKAVGILPWEIHQYLFPAHQEHRNTNDA